MQTAQTKGRHLNMLMLPIQTVRGRCDLKLERAIAHGKQQYGWHAQVDLMTKRSEDNSTADLVISKMTSAPPCQLRLMLDPDCPLTPTLPDQPRCKQ
eukprot:9470308-Pyramimonas_sp.AAC.1